MFYVPKTYYILEDFKIAILGSKFINMSVSNECFLLVEFHREGSAHNMATPSSSLRLPLQKVEKEEDTYLVSEGSQHLFIY